MLSPFIHLHLHTEYSLSDGLLRIDELIARAVALEQPAIAITDQSNLFATIKFYQAAIKAGIKPIIGAECWIENSQFPEQPFRLVLLCQNQQGYQNLIHLISRSYVEGRAGKPILQRSWFTQHSTGLIALSGGREGDIAQALLKEKPAQAKELLQVWLSLFPNRFYLELQRLARANEEEYIMAVTDLAAECSTPVVATNDVRFLFAADFDAHEARVCINSGHILNDPNRPKVYTEQQFLRSSEEMQQVFADIPSALLNSIEIAKRCNLELTFGRAFLPNFPIPQGMTPESFLIEEAKKGLLKRLEKMSSDFVKSSSEFLPSSTTEAVTETSKDRKTIFFDRLHTELEVITSMGFAGYFLIVADFIRWAKEQGIPVGPGRGSGAGSLVAYALQITDLEPLQYGLLFERFLNPERISMPDFDIDFCMEGRDRVIDYVTERYGRESVSQIITYGSMAARAVVRDVGRVLGYPYGMVDKLAKLIPFELGITLEKALIQEEQLKQRYDNEDEIKVLIDLAKKLEGLVRNVGKHAGGVVIAPSKLTDFTALYCEVGSTHCLTQFDKDDIEKVGLVKFDFLGLRTLTIIDWAVQSINLKKSAESALLDIAAIPLDDPKTFALLKAYKTAAVFQLESRGMRDLVKRSQPDSFEDIIALLALFRPGPLQSGMVDDFINRKQGKAKVEYPHPCLEPILRPTYGIILYQEQVMQIAQVLAGFTLGAADLLRRAMGKKKSEEMAKQRAIFTQGAQEKGVAIDLANQIFDLMEKFADYGFNKSHSAAYALVSYQTAWLKAHYPAEFMAAVLSSDMEHTEKVVFFLDECRLMKLKVLPPDINTSYYKFTVTEKGQLRYGLGALKGLGSAVIAMLIKKREEQRFKDLFDLCHRADLHTLNRRGLEALIYSGSLDSFGFNRATLKASLEAALLAAEQQLSTIASGQQDFFGLAMVSTEQEITQQADWPSLQRLQAEKEVLGFYLSGHPLENYAQELSCFITSNLYECSLKAGHSLTIAGWVLSIRSLWTKRGDRMAILNVEDASGRLEVTLFSDTYASYRDKLNKDKLLIIEGESQQDELTGNMRVLAKKILDISEAREIYAKRLLIKLSKPLIKSGQLETLKEKMSIFCPGLCSTVIEYHHPVLHSRLQLCLGDEWTVKPTDDLLTILRQLFGDESVVIQY
ncbi:DNA polymerase III subunit alpha [Rickettsiella endosymbiont of Dermanyssus gallinae]|uniref:DNA polymerase III subunit alpha n=1 Tax=Rickettsiella endosymbiont of Dermanyssus gallinae TaxID=2856608 RepID=UPI001C53308C|nr:DNA polymerase III subunit alpha [Rickettsiella endosymbiont of Dermanyssus gallinae]